MSVICLNDEVYSRVLESIDSFTYHPYFLPHSDDCEKTIIALRSLVYKSYAIRYSEITRMDEFKPVSCEPANIYQLLKTLQCIRYQIEVDEDSREIKALDGWIQSIMQGIIGQAPEYEAATWAS